MEQFHEELARPYWPQDVRIGHCVNLDTQHKVAALPSLKRAPPLSGPPTLT